MQAVEIRLTTAADVISDPGGAGHGADLMVEVRGDVLQEIEDQRSAAVFKPSRNSSLGGPEARDGPLRLMIRPRWITGQRTTEPHGSAVEG